MVVGLCAYLVDRLADLRLSVSRLGQMGGQYAFLDVAVFGTVDPVTEITVTQLVAEQIDDPVLRDAFRLADVGHGSVPHRGSVNERSNASVRPTSGFGINEFVGNI